MEKVFENELITCISLPRSGTNFILNEILRKIPEFNVQFEILSPYEDIKKSAINKKYYIEDIEKKDSFEIINHLMNQKEKYVIHKIFPDMFQTAYKKSLYLDKNEILLKIINESKYIFFIKRNFLDIYISEKKTHITKEWVIKDTSNIKIHFDTNDYINTINFYKYWFEYTKQKCIELEKPMIVIDYDELIKLENMNDMSKFCYDKFLLLTKDSNLSLNINYKYTFALTKQDNSEKYEDKIENYEEVKDFIETKEHHINNIV